MAPRAGLQRNAGLAERGPANYWHAKRQRRGPWPAARMPMLQGRKTHELLRRRAIIPDSCARRESGAAARRTGRRLQARRPPALLATHTKLPRARHAPRKPLTLAPPPAAVAQDLPHEADAREEDGPEPAHPPVDPHAHGQQDPLELEAAALAPHEARLVESLLKKTCSS